MQSYQVAPGKCDPRDALGLGKLDAVAAVQHSRLTGTICFPDIPPPV